MGPEIRKGVFSGPPRACRGPASSGGVLGAAGDGVSGRCPSQRTAASSAGPQPPGRPGSLPSGRGPGGCGPGWESPAPRPPPGSRKPPRGAGAGTTAALASFLRVEAPKCSVLSPREGRKDTGPRSTAAALGGRVRAPFPAPPPATAPEVLGGQTLCTVLLPGRGQHRKGAPGAPVHSRRGEWRERPAELTPLAAPLPAACGAKAASAGPPHAGRDEGDAVEAAGPRPPARPRPPRPKPVSRGGAERRALPVSGARVAAPEHGRRRADCTRSAPPARPSARPALPRRPPPPPGRGRRARCAGSAPPAPGSRPGAAR